MSSLTGAGPRGGPVARWRRALRGRGANAGRLRGAVDRFNGRVVDGWAFDPVQPDRPVRIVVSADGVAIAHGTADLERPDLAAAGFGSGRCGFALAVDNAPPTGGTVTLVVSSAGDGPVREIARRTIALDGEPVVPRIERFDIAGVHGSVQAPAGCLGTDDVVVVTADGEFAASARVILEPDGIRFAVTLPPRLYDGCVHVFDVELANHRCHVARVAEILPAVQTPHEELLAISAGSGYSALSHLAGYRYRALASRLRELALDGGADGEPDGEPDGTVCAADRAANVMLVHDIVVAGHAGVHPDTALVLPRHDDPQVSVIVPVHDGVALTRHCVAALILAAGTLRFEVILVDDRSGDATARFAASVRNLVVVRNATNLGFLHSCRAGVEVARADHLVFLNNDTEVCDGWLEALHGVFGRFARTGAVGAKLVYPDGRLQDAGGIVWDNGVPWNVGHGENAQAPEYNYVRDVDYLTGAALMVSREAWDAVGGFDPRYAPAYYEDTDLAFALREAGYRTLYCPHATVVHHEGGSHGTDPNAGVKRHQVLNAERFVARWRHAFAGLGPEGESVQLNKDRCRALRVLVIDHAFPCPGQDAGSHAAVQEMRLMIALGCKLTFVPHNFRHVGQHVDALQALGIECIHAPFHTSVEVFLERRGSEFDAVYITRFDVAERVLPHVRRHVSGPVLFNNADLHFLREMRAAIARGETDFRGEDGPAATRDREVAVMEQVDAVLSYNPTEREIIASHLMRCAHVFPCPWVLDVQPRPDSVVGRHDLVFLGGFAHPPNEDAVRWFAAEVMPLIVARRPGTMLRLFGSRLPASLGRELGASVRIEGFAPSLDDVFATCRVFVAPLRAGAGIKGKVLDAMAYGVPSVLSPVAIEATGLSHGVDALVARTPAEWADHCLMLLDDDAEWMRIAAAAHARAVSHYGFDVALEDMRHVFVATGLLKADGVDEGGGTGDAAPDRAPACPVAPWQGRAA